MLSYIQLVSIINRIISYWLGLSKQALPVGEIELQLQLSVTIEAQLRKSRVMVNVVEVLRMPMVAAVTSLLATLMVKSFHSLTLCATVAKLMLETTGMDSLSCHLMLLKSSRTRKETSGCASKSKSSYSATMKTRIRVTLNTAFFMFHCSQLF